MPMLHGAAETAVKEALKTVKLEKTEKLPNGGTDKGEVYLTDNGVVFIKQNMDPPYGDAEARELWSQLLLKLPQFFEGADIKPSLLHGNLQKSTTAETNSGPITFEPASFYGHQDLDLVTLQMCGGGLGKEFYKAYYDIIPKAPGSRKRNQIYKLFYLLNNWNQYGDEHKKKPISLMKYLLK